MLDRDILESQRHGDIIGDEAVSNMVMGEDGEKWRTKWQPIWKELKVNNDKMEVDVEELDYEGSSSADDESDGKND